ncbi:hypothetical protein [Chlorogloea sp. CCALA 695]|nr:hypothetical protein [Chlorogloea sp. CCALA 695]
MVSTASGMVVAFITLLFYGTKSDKQM